MSVVKQGAIPSMNYGCIATGINGALMRDMRKLQGNMAKIKCAGASLTAKLAMGGKKGADIDPAVLLHNPPLEAILARLWDDARSRSQLVKMWLYARDEYTNDDPTTRWRRSRGPVHAAMLQLRAVGADWPKPFFLHILDRDISVLDTPPKQITAILQAHTRRYLDLVLLDKLITIHAWEREAVMKTYENGIDWPLLRNMTYNGQGNLTGAGTHALKIISSHAYWSSHRRWQAGYRATGSCDLCFEAIGTAKHELHDCPALAADISLQQWAGNLRRLHGLDRHDLAPLWEMALPPKREAWQPIEVNFTEGALTQGYEGETYGDGSGYLQHSRESRVATWSIIRLHEDEEDEWAAAEQLRGNVAGWFSTVPRAEMHALAEHLRHAGQRGVYVGDCKMVIEAAKHGVPDKWQSWRNPNADLWRIIKQRQDDHGGQLNAVKVKSHRGRNTVGDGDDYRRWRGNTMADEWAKSLAKTMAESRGDIQQESGTTPTTDYEDVLRHIAFAGACLLKRRPLEAKGTDKRTSRSKAPTIHQHGGHDIITRKLGGWECSQCRRLVLSKVGLKDLRNTTCTGTIGEPGAVHSSHRMQHTNGVYWCASCGAYATRWPRDLKRACRGAPNSEAQANVKRRLSSGLGPTTAKYLDDSREIADKKTNKRTGTANSAPRPYHGKYLRLPGGPLAHTRTASHATGRQLPGPSAEHHSMHDADDDSEQQPRVDHHLPSPIDRRTTTQANTYHDGEGDRHQDLPAPRGQQCARQEAHHAIQYGVLSYHDKGVHQGVLHRHSAEQKDGLSYHDKGVHQGVLHRHSAEQKDGLSYHDKGVHQGVLHRHSAEQKDGDPCRRQAHGEGHGDPRAAAAAAEDVGWRNKPGSSTRSIPPHAAHHDRSGHSADGNPLHEQHEPPAHRALHEAQREDHHNLGHHGAASTQTCGKTALSSTEQPRRRLRQKTAPSPRTTLNQEASQLGGVDLSSTMHLQKESLGDSATAHSQSRATAIQVIENSTFRNCRTTMGKTWISRVTHTEGYIVVSCSACGKATRTRCRRCNGGLCLICAKADKTCRVTTE